MLAARRWRSGDPGDREFFLVGLRCLVFTVLVGKQISVDCDVFSGACLRWSCDGICDSLNPCLMKGEAPGNWYSSVSGWNYSYRWGVWYIFRSMLCVEMLEL